MRVLFLQLTAPDLPPGAVQYSHALGTLLSCVRRAGHEIDLLGLGEPDGDILRGRLEKFPADAVFLWYRSFHVPAARRLGVFLAAHHPAPLIAAGPHPTAVPAEALSLPGVTGTAIGECERSVVEFLDKLQSGRDYTDTLGLWFNSAAGPVRNDLAPLVHDLDELPFPERRMFHFAESAAESGVAEFHVGRGCPQWCGYCLNDWLSEINEGKGPFVRRRSVGNLLAEVRQVIAEFPGVQRLSFPDCTFAADKGWLAKFTESYPDEFVRPFSCHIRANTVDDETVGLLKAAGCESAHVEVVSGSDFIRNDVFHMETSAAQLSAAFQMLRRRGIRVTARNFVGSPYDSEITIEETVRLTRELRPDAVTTFQYHPVPATTAADMCREQGWISGRSEEDFLRNKSVMDLAGLPPKEIRRHQQELEAAVLDGSGGILARLARGLRSERGPHPLSFREDGTLFAPPDGPVRGYESAAVAVEISPAWETVRSGLYLTVIGLTASLFGLLLMALGVAASSSRVVDGLAAWIPVVVGFYGSLFGAVVWLTGYTQCLRVPGKARARGALIGSIGCWTALAALLFWCRTRLSGGEQWTAAAAYSTLTASHVLWAAGNGLFGVFLSRVAGFFAADSVTAGVAAFQRLNLAATLGGVILAVRAFTTDAHGLYGWMWLILVDVLVLSAAAAMQVRLTLRTHRLLAGRNGEPTPAVEAAGGGISPNRSVS
jgi:radical SAM superfamily enzyme YgiQ (UPF0313 family)